MPNAVRRKSARSHPLHLCRISAVFQRVAAAIFILCSLVPSSLSAGETPQKINSATDVLETWSPTQHLYVKGDIRVDAASLDGLEKWLDANGKNWTVVLMASASGETWRDDRGASHQGMDAVENSLGRGLGNMPAFASLKDARTGQPNGAIFILFLQERKFSYFGSEVFDRRGLGESAWIGKLDGPARDAMRSGGRIVDAVKNTVTHIESILTKRIADEERIRREAKQRRERMRKITVKTIVTGGGIAACVGLGLLGFGANRRRRKQKHRAELVLAEWQAKMKNRYDRLFRVMDRAGVVVGAEKDLPERGYEGETLSESIRAIRAIDRAFILSSGVDDVIDRVEKLIQPSSVAPKVVNLFSRSRYQRAIDLLDQGVSVAGARKIKVAGLGEDALLGDLPGEQREGFLPRKALSFAALIEQFDSTLNSADAALDRVDSAWETVAGRTEMLSRTLRKIARQESSVRSASLGDGWLAAESLFSTWHPAAAKLAQRGIELGKHDPVSALDKLRGPIPRAETMAEEMQHVMDTIGAFRSDKLGSMLEQLRSLRRLGRRTDWVNVAMRQLSEELDSLSNKGAKSAVMPGCKSLRARLDALPGRVHRVLTLANEANEGLPKAAKKVTRSADDARAQLGRELRISRSELLCERDGWNPDALVKKAEALRANALDYLDKGEAEPAANAVKAAHDATTLAGKVVKETLAAYQEFEPRQSNARKLARQADALEDKGLTILTELRKRYAEAALLYEPDAAEGETFATAGEDIGKSVHAIGCALSHAADAFSRGHILTARNHLIDVENQHRLVSSLHRGLTERQTGLAELAEENTLRLRDALDSLAGMRNATSDARVCQDTLTAFDQLEVKASEAKTTVHAPYGESNPYSAGRALDELGARLRAMESQIESDRDSFAGAEKMLAAARSAARDATRIAGISRADGIPDSPDTRELVSRIEDCTERLRACHDVLETPHAAWRELAREINRQHTRLGEAIAGLKNDLRKARLAVESLRLARAAVDRAVMWSGSFGFRITGSHGASHLQSAHNALSRGDYGEANRTAAFARTRARQALAAAEAREASMRRRREEASRRIRQRVRFSSPSSHLGSSSWSSSSSGFSSSSFSSGSGFSRSGW